MKDTKPLAWLLPLAGLLILFGWFLGRAGWNLDQIDVGVGALKPPTATLSVPQQASTQQSATPIIGRPAGFHLKVGEEYKPPQGWIWVCTGDFAFMDATGRRFEYYDSQTTTGLVLVLGEDSNVILSGPLNMPQGTDIGDCTPFLPAEKERGVSNAISAQLTVGCGSKCSSVRVVEIGRNGIVADYWKP